VKRYGRYTDIGNMSQKNCLHKLGVKPVQ
jgi:hypothetical protein